MEIKYLIKLIIISFAYSLETITIIVSFFNINLEN